VRTWDQTGMFDNKEATASNTKTRVDLRTVSHPASAARRTSSARTQRRFDDKSVAAGAELDDRFGLNAFKCDARTKNLIPASFGSCRPGWRREDEFSGKDREVVIVRFFRAGGTRPSVQRTMQSREKSRLIGCCAMRGLYRRFTEFHA